MCYSPVTYGELVPVCLSAHMNLRTSTSPSFVAYIKFVQRKIYIKKDFNIKYFFLYVV